ncbi:MAG: LytR/AlgR family response regulator transcription factor [Betaproteobacteria bacterium]
MNSTLPPTRAVLADDERLMREQLRLRLSQAWPTLEIVAEARNGLEALELVAQHRPDVVFLDIRMPGLTGVEAAREILQMETAEDEWLPEMVFITAYDEYAVQAFEHGAVDYVLKPASLERLAKTVDRLGQRLKQRQQYPAIGGDGETASPASMQALLQALSAQLRGPWPPGTRLAEPQHLEVLQATSGSTVHLIPVRDVLFFISDEKYTRVQTATTEALIRKPIKELVNELDPRQFWQIHRSSIVNVQAVAQVIRDERGRQIVKLRDHPQSLEVSRSFAGVFKGM